MGRVPCTAFTKCRMIANRCRPSMTRTEAINKRKKPRPVLVKQQKHRSVSFSTTIYRYSKTNFASLQLSINLSKITRVNQPIKKLVEKPKKPVLQTSQATKVEVETDNLEFEQLHSIFQERLKSLIEVSVYAVARVLPNY